MPSVASHRPANMYAFWPPSTLVWFHVLKFSHFAKFQSNCHQPCNWRSAPVSHTVQRVSGVLSANVSFSLNHPPLLAGLCAAWVKFSAFVYSATCPCACLCVRAGPPQTRQWETLAGHQLNWNTGDAVVKRVGSVTGNRINNMLFNDCFTVVTFNST